MAREKRFTVVVGDDLHKRVKIKATRLELSVSQVIRALLTKFIESDAPEVLEYDLPAGGVRFEPREPT